MFLVSYRNEVRLRYLITVRNVDFEIEMMDVISPNVEMTHYLKIISKMCSTFFFTKFFLVKF